MTLSNQIIEEMEFRLVDAIKTRDVNSLDQLLHDDLLCIIPNTKTITKQIDLASYEAGELVIEVLTANIENVSIINDTAITTVFYELNGFLLGEPITGRYKYLRVWKAVDDGLKVIAATGIQLDK